jgi:hypothetical protein
MIRKQIVIEKEKYIFIRCAKNTKNTNTKIQIQK